MKATGKSLGNFLADRTVAVQDVGDTALRRAVSQILLFKAVLPHQEAQHFARLHFGNREILVLVGFDLIGEVIKHFSQWVAFVVTDFIKQHINRGANLRIGAVNK